MFQAIYKRVDTILQALTSYAQWLGDLLMVAVGALEAAGVEILESFWSALVTVYGVMFTMFATWIGVILDFSIKWGKDFVIELMAFGGGYDDGTIPPEHQVESVMTDFVAIVDDIAWILPLNQVVAIVASAYLAKFTIYGIQQLVNLIPGVSVAK